MPKKEKLRSEIRINSKPSIILRKAQSAKNKKIRNSILTGYRFEHIDTQLKL